LNFAELHDVSEQEDGVIAHKTLKSE